MPTTASILSPLRALRLAIVLCMVVAPASAATNPFRVECHADTLEPGSEGMIEVRVVVPSGYYVYRDMMSVEVLDAGGLTLGEASFPPGIFKPDPANPGTEREQFDMDVFVQVPVRAPSEAAMYSAWMKVRYQGCKQSLCYMPQVEEVEARVRVARRGIRKKPR